MARVSRKSSFPWILFLVFLLSIYLFWIYPGQRGSQQIDVIPIESNIPQSGAQNQP